MPERVEALIKPALLAWAREATGLDVSAAARKAGVKPERLEAWEIGERRPTINQLRTLARIYKRPIAVFYLPEPPPPIRQLLDYRRLPGEVAGIESPDLRWEIRSAITRREVALELLADEGESPPQFKVRAELTDGHDAVGDRIRAALAVPLATQRNWRDPYESFNGWRGAIESAGALVLQMTSVEMAEARGFSIIEPQLPVIVVNIKDAPAGRVFTLLHEFAHLLFRQSGICDLDDVTTRSADALQVERFCNAAAGAALVPAAALRAEPIVARHASTIWTDHSIRELALGFGVSREVILRRLLDLSLTTDDFYKAKREEFLEEYEEARQRRESGFAPPHQMALASVGPAFAGLVLSSYAHGHITASDVSDYLGVRLKHLPRIEDQLLARSRRG